MSIFNLIKIYKTLTFSQQNAIRNPKGSNNHLKINFKMF